MLENGTSYKEEILVWLHSVVLCVTPVQLHIVLQGSLGPLASHNPSLAFCQPKVKEGE